MNEPSVAVIGFDNRLAGDGEPAAAIIKALEGRLPGGVAALVVGGGAAELARRWRGYETVILADRLTPAGSPGAVRVWDAGRIGDEGEASFREMNGAELAAAIDQSRKNDALPANLLIVGVEGRAGGCGVGLCPEVADGVREAADWVLKQLAVRMAA